MAPDEALCINEVRYNAITLAVFGRQRGILDILLFVLNKTYTPDKVQIYLTINPSLLTNNPNLIINPKNSIDVLNEFVYAELYKPKNITHLILTYGNGNQLEKFDQVTKALGKVVSPMLTPDKEGNGLSVNLNKFLDNVDEKILGRKVEDNGRVVGGFDNTHWLFQFVAQFPIFGLFVIDWVVQSGVITVGAVYLLGGGLIALVLEIIKIMIYTYPRLMMSRLKNNIWNRFTTSSTLEGIISNLDPIEAKKNLKLVIQDLNNKKNKEGYFFGARSHRKILHAIYDVAKKRNWLDNHDFKTEKTMLENSFHSLSFHNATRFMRGNVGGKKRARVHRTRKNKKK